LTPNSLNYGLSQAKTSFSFCEAFYSKFLVNTLRLWRVWGNAANLTFNAATVKASRSNSDEERKK
jgi:hypothetical protein